MILHWSVLAQEEIQSKGAMQHLGYSLDGPFSEPQTWLTSEN